MRLLRSSLDWLRGWATRPEPDVARTPVTHVIMLDGTMSSMVPGHETNVGLTYQLLQDVEGLCLYYEPGIQWRGLRHAHEVVAGVGINQQIKRAYHWLAQAYQPGDRIYLVGYSRGAYAVRALAGFIGRIGLLRAETASRDRVWQAYDHYRCGPMSPEARRFGAAFCHPKAEIEAVAVYDTVRALGISWPLVWRLVPQVHAFHDQLISQGVKRGFHALARDERRVAFAPVLWEVPAHRAEDVEQRWFRGNHGDIGGHLAGFHAARPLSNYVAQWMLGELEGTGLTLPADWRDRFPADPHAPSTGGWRGFGALFWSRRKRALGQGPSQQIDPMGRAA